MVPARFSMTRPTTVMLTVTPSSRAAQQEDDRPMALHFGSTASAGRWENLRRRSFGSFGERDRDRHGGMKGVNVGTAERWISGFVGAALTLTALRRRRLRGVLLPMGGGLLWRAV